MGEVRESLDRVSTHLNGGLNLNRDRIGVTPVCSGVREEDFGLTDGGGVNVAKFGAVGRVVASLDSGIGRVGGDLSGLVGGEVRDELGGGFLAEESLKNWENGQSMSRVGGWRRRTVKLT
jgi:hypothetical protein